jgi:sporulation-control protein
MAFKKLLASLGAGGASVETVLTEVNVVPGGVVQGEVRIQGGSVNQEIQGLSVGLQAKVEVESGDQEYKQDIEFTKVRLGDAFELQAGAVHAVPFGLEIPWETPITTIDGQALPAQKAILDAFIRLGFRFKNADMERGHIRGTRQKLPFYQEIEFFPPSQYRGLNQVELSFVADENAMDVILEMDKKPGLFSEGSDTFRSFQVGLHDFHGTDWAAYLNQWLSEVGSKRNWF